MNRGRIKCPCLLSDDTVTHLVTLEKGNCGHGFKPHKKLSGKNGELDIHSHTHTHTYTHIHTCTHTYMCTHRGV